MAVAAQPPSLRRLAAICVITVALAWAVPASACVRPWPSTIEAVREASLIFRGTLIGYEACWNPLDRFCFGFRFRVTGQWKGPSRAEFHIESSGPCALAVRPGDDVLVYAASEVLSPYTEAPRTQPFSGATEDLKVLGPPLSSARSRLAPADQTAVVLAAAAVVGIAALLRRRFRHQYRP